MADTAPSFPHNDDDRRTYSATQFDRVSPLRRRRRAVPRHPAARPARTADECRNDEEKQQFLDMQFTAQKTHYEQHFPDCEFPVIEMDRTAIGSLHRSRRG
jgi:hypothetical protein